MTTTTQTIDLVSLIEQNTGFRAVGSANNRLNGTEHWGMCPFCGTGNDRFHVFPHAEKPHFWCRSCQKTGDHIDILTHFKNLTFIEACQELGISPGETIRHEAPMFFDEDPPSPKWQSMARILSERAQAYLWEKGHEALEYLLKRGISEATIRTAHLGYVPLARDGKWFTRSFDDWGLTDEVLTNKQKEKGCVKVPPGISIPWESDGQIWKLAVKRFEAKEGEMRYGQVVGSRDALYNSDSLARGKPALLLEGELDVLSAQQEARDLISPIGTGSTEKARIPLWIAKMASLASCTLIGLDSDQAGDKASQYWLEVLPNSMRWTPFSHDVNQMLQDKVSIRDWVQMGLDLMNIKPEEQQHVTDASKLIGDDLSLVCSQCGNPVNYYSPEGVAFCEVCWTKTLVPLQEIPEVHRCKQCQKETLRSESDGLCSWCFMETLPKANPPREPVAIRDRWFR